MGKALAVVFWGLAVAGGVAYYVHSKPAPIASYPVAAAPVVVKPFEPSVPETAEPPKSDKPRTMEVFGFAQAVATKTLIVTPPPALGSPYTITLFLNGAIGPDSYVGINPADAPSIYSLDASIGNPPWVAGVRNHLPVVWAYRCVPPDHLLYQGAGVPPKLNRPAEWRVFFTAAQGYADWGGGYLRESSESPLVAIPYTTTNGWSSVTNGWSFRLTD